MWRIAPGALAFTLLALQMAVPWTATHFVTQDGPSHLYGATIARDLLINRGSSVYAPLYRIQPSIVPNWTSTVALAMAESIVGPEHANQLLVSALMLIGFLGFGYAVRTWTPVANVLIQTWFLGVGFYNFYLGMALLLFVVGYYTRHAERLNRRDAIVLAAGLLAVFFTHVVAAAIAVMTVLVVGIWITLFPTPVQAFRLRQLRILLAAVAPVLILAAIYVHGAAERPTQAPASFDPQILKSWNQFPMQVFGNSNLPLTELVLFFIVAGALLMRRREWRTIQGGLAFAAFATFLAYLFLPDVVFGGEAVKIRLSWAVFLLGGVMACSVSRLRVIQAPIALFVAWLLFSGVTSSAKSVRAVSQAADDYLSVANQIPPKAAFVRLRYPASALAARFGYQDLGWDPLFHLDGVAASRQHLIDLTDYEALSKLFPIVYRETVEQSQQYGLWGFEGPGKDSVEVLTWLTGNFPVRIDFALIVGDERSPEAVRMNMPAMLDYLGSSMRLVATSPSGFVRLYGRRDLVSGAYDDLDPAIEYTGTWLHDRQFAEPFGGSITYSRQAGDTARLTFSGRSVTFFYTKALNRGIAQVSIDGADVAQINFYSEKTQWRAESTFGDLKPGRHIIEVRVLGQKDTRSSDSWVDLDRFLIAP
jgi:hypothetical protein